MSNEIKIYDKKYLRESLIAHGYTPQVLDAGWIQLAINLEILKRLDSLLNK